MQHDVAKVLKAAAQRYAGQGDEERQQWITHSGKTTSHHMGPAVVLRRLGVVKKCHVKHRGALHLLKTAQAFRVSTSIMEMTRARAHVEKYVHFADTLGCLPVTRTAKQWGVAVLRILQAIDKTAPPGSC
jgi:hypothetical protein